MERCIWATLKCASPTKPYRKTSRAERHHEETLMRPAATMAPAAAREDGVEVDSQVADTVAEEAAVAAVGEADGRSWDPAFKVCL
jgi:hypothetical protein